MITELLSPEAKAYLKANAAQLEADTQVWLDNDLAGACPTEDIEQILLAEMIDCLGTTLARPMFECLAPKGGWPPIVYGDQA